MSSTTIRPGTAPWYRVQARGILANAQRLTQRAAGHPPSAPTDLDQAINKLLRIAIDYLCKAEALEAREVQS